MDRDEVTGAVCEDRAVWDDTRRILIADDDVDTLELLSVFAEAVGYEVIAASDGVQALLLAEQTRPDVALLDLRIPHLDGFDVAQHLRRQSWARSTLIIAQTAVDEPGDKARALAAGFDAHFTKPLDLAVVFALLVSAAVGRLSPGSC